MQSSASDLGMQLTVARVHDEVAVDQAVNAIAREGDAGLIFPSDPFTATRLKQMVDIAAHYALPAVYPFRSFAESGGLLSYGVDLLSQYAQAASYIDRILKGVKSSDLPVQTPTKFQLVVNLKTAKALGLLIPPALLAQADETIE